mgnify:CR=1 FL=1
MYKKNYGVNLECFGSFINHTLKYYFGLFYDLERHFSCLGNLKGLFLINPQFIPNIMNDVINKINKSIMKNKISIIPLWNVEDRLIINKYCKKTLSTDYKTDLYSHILLKNKYAKNYLLYCQESIINILIIAQQI